MQNRNFLTILFFLCITFFANAQKSVIYTNDQQDLQRAISLYKDQQYLSAQIIFDQIQQSTTNLETQADCSYYSATAAIKLDQVGADSKMENFLKNYPTSTKTNSAIVEVAQYYFDQNQFDKALQWFDKVDENNISTTTADQFNFQRGYCYFVAKNIKDATSYFNRVINSTEFGSQAKYYLGYMAYETNDYKEANKQFDQVADQDKYKEKMSYFQADMNFKLANFQKSIDLGLLAINKSNAVEKSELSKIIGESYFNLKKYNEAIPYLQDYKGKKGKWNNTDFYILGYSFYKSNDFENAIATFNKIIDGNDFVAQNGYYHLGESYLKTNKKPQALNAFKNASEMSFDLKIQEDAALNYAKLSYEIGNSYQAVPDVLNNFIQKYPNNEAKTEVETLLINSFITSKNFKDAMVLLEKNKTVANKPTYQKVTFYRALELYNDSKYNDAMQLLAKSIAEPRDAVFTSRAVFWKAETDFVLDNFEEAVLGYKQFLGNTNSKSTPEFKNIQYNIGYTHFKLKQYDQAVLFFQNFIDTKPTDKLRLNDSYLRLADGNFVLAKYYLAIESYSKSIELNTVDKDYASFQRSICFGFINKNDKKIDYLNQFLTQFPKSQYRDDALFELGNTHIVTKEDDKAVATFDVLLTEFNKGIYAPKALLKQGLIYYNADKDQPALAKLKKVAADYPSSPEALEAVATARLIYFDSGKVDEYADWVKTLNFVQVTDVELDNDTYESAEKQYLQNNTKPAITGFVSYLARFPKGKHTIKANFYLAQLYFADGLEGNAIPNYESVVVGSKNEFTEQALVRLAQIHLKSNNLDKAINVLRRLEAEADYPQNITFAQANLMKSYYEKQDYANAVLAAEKVLANPKTDDKVKSDALIIVARSAIKNNEEDKARVAYAKLFLVAKGELAAEALYFDAYFKNKDNKFELSNMAIQKLSKNYSGYKYFGAKGLVVMAKNFYGLKDAFQANYILDSVIKNFKDFADVVAEAKTEQDKIQVQEALTNSSIQK